MVTITEDYVSSEIAELLREKGFPQSTLVCNTVYKPNGCISNNAKSFISPCYIGKDIYVFAPTLQMAMKWLREAHNIHIWVEPNHDKEGLYNAHVKVCWWSNNWAGIGYNTHEKASEEAIKYCLENLI